MGSVLFGYPGSSKYLLLRFANHLCNKVTGLCVCLFRRSVAFVIGLRSVVLVNVVNNPFLKLKHKYACLLLVSSNFVLVTGALVVCGVG